MPKCQSPGVHISTFARRHRGTSAPRHIGEPDYSFNGLNAFTATTKVTVYRVGTLVYGTEPP